jgi:hypothetical protein
MNSKEKSVEKFQPDEFAEISWLCNVLNYNMDPRSETRNRKSNYALPGEEDDARARFLNNLALLCCDDSRNVVAVAVHVLGDHQTSTLYVASNMQSTRAPLNEYVQELRNKLTDSSAPNTDAIKVMVYKRTHLVLQKKCRKFFRRKEDRLAAESKLQSNPEYLDRYNKLKGLIQEHTPLADLPIVSELADAFTKDDRFKEFFSEKEPTFRRLKKIGAYARALWNVRQCATNPQYRELFKATAIIHIEPKIKTITLRPIAEVFHNWSQSEESFEMYDVENRRSRFNATPTLTQHAEMLIAEFLSNKPHHGAYIGISKLCCYLCYQVLQRWPGEQKYIVAGTHGKMAPTWLPPSSLPAEVTLGIKAEMVHKLEERIKCHDDRRTDSETESAAIGEADQPDINRLRNLNWDTRDW